MSASALATTTYSAGTPSVDGVLNGPWNTSQGDPGEGSMFGPVGPTSQVAGSLLFPTYTPGGNTTSIGGVTEPNLAVYPGASSGSSPFQPPYPSGVVGTPGPLDDYCGSGDLATEQGGSPSSEPTGTDLPMAPYYFPDIVRNADGSLTGYFDWRPKDADEEITVARSTDDGLTWTTEGSGLEQNDGYCPEADTNDDGQGHPFVMSVGGGNMLYTLQRAAGDNSGVGLLVHSIGDNASADPLAGAPSTEQVGVDPNTFATSQTPVPTTGGATIPVSTLGTAGTVTSIVPGPYVDDTSTPPNGGSPAPVITCTGIQTAPDALTGCTVSGTTAVTVASGDDLVQVIATAAPGSGATYTVPASSSQTPAGGGGLGTLALATGTNGQPNTTSNSDLLTGVLNVNAPNRIYIDGHTVYCSQANANPTTKLEDCTSPTGPFTVSNGDAITADPITPATAQMTTGLIAPDGIVGVMPSGSYGAAAGDTVVLYTEKILSYFISGTINGFVSGGTYTAATGGSKDKFTLPQGTINYEPSLTTSEQPPASGTFTVYLGSTTAAPGTSGSTSNPIQAITCTGSTTAVPSAAPAGSVDLTGCTGGSGFVASGNWVGAPNAAIAPYSALGQIGEGKNGASSGPEKLFGNNEDLTVLRAAETSDGVNFTDLGAVSGDGTPEAGSESGTYDDIANANQQDSPQDSADPATATVTPNAPTNMTAGASDQVELRYIGSRGTIITNPDGSIGMFLSGSWSSDGDSDAFNQIFYTSSSDGGVNWSVPRVALSTDYTFAASAEQDSELTGGQDDPLGISAYYSGRAYGPTVVQNPDGSLTMVFSGYRLPSPVQAAGTALGTDASDQYTVGTTDPALYRNILTTTLSSSSSPLVGTSSALTTSDSPVATGTPVTYTDTVMVAPGGSGTPTGTVDFNENGNPITGCQNVALPDSVADDDATCTTVPDLGDNTITAVYSGDSNYASSTGTTDEDVVTPGAPTATITTPADGGAYTQGAIVDADYSCGDGSFGPGIASCTDSEGVGNGNPIDTGTPGGHTFTVTAVSGDGQSATATVTYTVTALVTNTIPPRIVGTPTDGRLLIALHGTWHGDTALTYSYQWDTCRTHAPSSCTPIAPAATRPTLRLTHALVGDLVSVTVTATDGTGFSSSATATPVGPVNQPAPPRNLVAPRVVGVAKAGRTLRASTGVWSSADPLSYSYSWELCTSSALASCSAISGAGGTTLALTSTDAGSYIAVVVTATDAESQSSSAAAITADPVAAGPRHPSRRARRARTRPARERR